MAVEITLRDVPESLRDAIVARAALHGQSMEEFILSTLDNLVSKPPVEELLKGVRARLEASDSQVSTSSILRHLREDRGR